MVNAFTTMLNDLFIPDENYFTTKFDEIKSAFLSKMPVDTSSLDSLKSVSDVALTNVQGSYLGNSYTFIDLSIWTDYLPSVKNIIRGFVYPFLIFFNVNQIYFLIRGKKLFGGN
jgi:hypothetical protein